ncbi:IS5 family transposase [Natrialba sp. INN-245]|uniref:IS5 family transposase n=1 Tax=Natrialba sp. INN-245 TaxID=2690967 RepID=UPI00131168C7|nr:IS5 family transposase [Natrialba sp. INN-245]MWV38845.1 IS5 family transposase [Natrialba sp. INN-245]
MTSEIRLLTRVTVANAKSVVDNPDEPADPEGGGGFAEWAMLTLHALRIELDKSYRITVDLLSDMPAVLEEIGLTRLPHYTVLHAWFERIPTKTWRAFLGASAEKRTGHAAIDSTGFDRDQPSRHYANRTHYRVRALKVTALVDVETLYITDIHSTTSKKHDAKIGPRVARRNAGDLLTLAADKGYDGMSFREELRAEGVRPLIKHRVFAPYDHAHNARIEDNLYNQRSVCETVNSVTKRSYGSAVRARAWFRQFREITLAAAVYNVEQAVKQ